MSHDPLPNFDRSEDLRQQLRQGLKRQNLTQGDLARARRVKPQTVNLVFTGKRPIIGQTLEATLESLQARLVVSRLEDDPDAVSKKAFSYGYHLFPKAPRERHEAFCSCVAWLTTGEVKDLKNSLRSLAVQSQLSPILSFEQAVCAVLPLVYGSLTEIHRSVVEQGTQGDDWWDSRQVILWRQELGLGNEE